MAFTEQEQKIIDWGSQNGKSGTEIREEVFRFRTTGLTASERGDLVTTQGGAVQTPSFRERAGARIETAGGEIEEHIIGGGEFADDSPLVRGLESTAKLASVPLQVGFEALPETKNLTFRSGLRDLGSKVGNLISSIGERIGSTKVAQDFVTEHPEAAERLEELSRIGQAGGEIAGNILAAEGGVRATQKVTAGVRDLTNRAGQAIRRTANEISAIENPFTTNSFSKAKTWFQEPIKSNVETALRETPTTLFDDYVRVARESILDNKKLTPLEIAGQSAGDALNQMTRKLDTIGANKSAVLEGAVGNQPVGNIVVKFRQEIQNSLKGKTSVEGNKKLFRDVLSEAEKLGNNPTAVQVDAFIDFVQSRIFTGKRDLTVPITKDVDLVLRPPTGRLNDALKAQLPESYTTLNERFSSLVEIRNELNVKLGKSGERGGSLMKKVFSSSDANTKELFAKVLDETGIDLVNEATLARFTMDVLGDARQKSMLEQLNLLTTKPTPSGIVDRIVQYGLEKFNDPEAFLLRARELTSGQ